MKHDSGDASLQVSSVGAAQSTWSELLGGHTDHRVLLCRQAIEAKRCLLESVQKRCAAAQAKLEGEYSHLGSLEAKTKQLENLRKV